MRLQVPVILPITYITWICVTAGMHVPLVNVSKKPVNYHQKTMSLGLQFRIKFYITKGIHISTIHEANKIFELSTFWDPLCYQLIKLHLQRSS